MIIPFGYFETDEDVIPGEMTLTSTSVLNPWSPDSVVNSGTTLDWTVTGGVTIAKTTVNDPSFDFSSNSGTANVLIENVKNLTDFRVQSLSIVTLNTSEAISLTTLYCYSNGMITLNLGAITNLTNLRCYFNSISTLDVDNNTSLTQLWCYNNSITSLRVNNNTSLSILYCHNNGMSASATNQVLADVVGNSVNGGNLIIRNNATGQGLTDIATLEAIPRNWTVTQNAE